MTATETAAHYFKFSTNWTANGERRCGDCDQTYEAGQHIEITTLKPFTNYVCPAGGGYGHSGTYTGALIPSLRTLHQHLCICGAEFVEEDTESWTLTWEMKDPWSAEWRNVSKTQSKHAAHAQRAGLLELIERGEAIRNVELTDDAAAPMQFEVHELGEDGDAWIVSRVEGWGGGGSEEAAKLAVVEWLHGCVGDDESAFGHHVAELLRAPVTHHGHWAWHTAEPYDDALLIRLSHDHKDVETFTGWLFSSHIPPIQDVSEYLTRRTMAA